MINMMASVWALLLGVVLIMLGNGMHFTLMGLRGGIEGFSSAELSIVTSAYFLGFLSGARLTPALIQRVGHVRVFAALGSFISAALIAFTLWAEPWSWTVLRIIIGFCMSGVYVVAESWLNNATTNENRGKMLSAYMLAQTLGIIGAQGLLTLGDAANAALFIGASILVSISFAPILLSVQPAPAVQVAKPGGLKDLFDASPLGTVGIFLLGSIYASQSGMGAVFGSEIGLSPNQIALFVAMLFGGAILMQLPIGWLSDRIDRRKIICGTAFLGAAACGMGYMAQSPPAWLSVDPLIPIIAAAFFAGGMTTPLYALLLAYANDNVPAEDMPAISGGLVFTFGLGAILGPIVAGLAMEAIGPFAFWIVLGFTFLAITLYALYRMSQTEAKPVSETDAYVNLVPTASIVAVDDATIWAAEHAEAEQPLT
ncbi:MFS transporter [Yoonia sediminilitoris]|uniref:Putative MFS family arabinose efflux permease n=1 Tax=Yoonia sediminilitoris TaxID=1286148 RepID=A0A2T6KRD1_9RHOB|nr:MFS transporter [Yoonia sediminilitoris]PUB19107.1 putative MFS family arabinose efflux permease [Yoonia sediminilitoris]RCW99275.1 putative MFS family arabinose efflux permease [Yoonia sediminilitoris]